VYPHAELGGALAKPNNKDSLPEDSKPLSSSKPQVPALLTSLAASVDDAKASSDVQNGPPCPGVASLTSLCLS
jgi:hypothetical protein